jgi:hypothetical protein
MDIPPTRQCSSCQGPVAGPRVPIIIFSCHGALLHPFNGTLDITRGSFAAVAIEGNIYATPRGQYEGGFSLFEENGAILPCV